MGESLFIQYIQQFFKGIVLNITETLNGVKNGVARYRYKEMLTREYSVDGKWETLIGENTNVAADVVAMDSDLPLKSRDSISAASGEIPKMGMKLWLNERQMTNLFTLQKINVDGSRTKELIRKIFNDTARCITGVMERIEFMFLEGLSTGMTLTNDDNNTGIGVRVNYGYMESHKFGVTAEWSDHQNSKPIDDIARVLTKATADNTTPTKLMLDRTTFNHLIQSSQIKEYYGALLGLNVPFAGALTLTQINELLRERFGLTIDIVERTVKTEKNGVATMRTPWASGMVIFLSDNNVGSLIWADLAEKDAPVEGVSYQTADEFILVSKYRKNEPSVSEWTSSQARVLPVISAVDEIFQLDSKTVQA